MIHALLDTNVVLDILLDRPPWNTDAAILWRAVLNRQFIAYITATSVTDIFYIIRRHAGHQKAWQAVQTCLDQLSPLLQLELMTYGWQRRWRVATLKTIYKLHVQ